MEGKISILATAPVGDTATEIAAGYGIQLDVIPFIAINALQSEELRLTINKYAAEKRNVVFTSGNGVASVGEQVAGVHADWSIYCLGNKTKSVVNQYFSENKISSECNNAAELADVIIRDGVKEVVFFCGDRRMDTLPDTLRAAGIEVTEVVVYSTVATPQKVSGEYDGVLFFSPSGVESFFGVNMVKETAVMFAIGETTAGMVRKHTSNRVVVSGNAAKEDVVSTAIGYFL
jgi:uroporphyrinogen-III synthase